MTSLRHELKTIRGAVGGVGGLLNIKVYEYGYTCRCLLLRQPEFTRRQSDRITSMYGTSIPYIIELHGIHTLLSYVQMQALTLGLLQYGVQFWKLKQYSTVQTYGTVRPKIKLRQIIFLKRSNLTIALFTLFQFIFCIGRSNLTHIPRDIRVEQAPVPS